MSSVAPATTTPAIDINYELTKGFAARCIRLKTWKMMGHTLLRKADREDLHQELALAVFRSLPQFDAKRGDWKAFVSTVIERRAANILYRRRAECRSPGFSTDSLDILVTDADGVDVPLATQIGSHHLSAVTGFYPATDEEVLEARLDAEALLEPLPQDERDLIMELAEKSQRAAASERGVARRTIRSVLERARGRFIGEEQIRKISKK